MYITSLNWSLSAGGETTRTFFDLLRERSTETCAVSLANYEMIDSNEQKPAFQPEAVVLLPTAILWLCDR